MKGAAGLFGVLLLLASPARSAWAEVEVGNDAPELKGLQTASGADAPAPAFVDVVVVTFGASWCAPCKKELPALERLAANYEKRKSRVVFYAVNIDSELDKGAAFAKELGLKKVKVLFDPKKKAAELYGPPKMPTTYVITAGKVAHVHGGFEKGDDARILRVINQELGKLSK